MTRGAFLGCSVCCDPILGDTGYVGAAYEQITGDGPIRWIPSHDGCRPDDHMYSIDAVELTTADGLAKWTEHLAGKTWWDRAMRSWVLVTGQYR